MHPEPPAPDALRIVALLAVRNGAPYIERYVQQFAGQGIRIAAIDHDSTDGTYEFLKQHEGAAVCNLIRVPFDGVFDLRAMMIRQQEQAKRIDAEWLIRADIDEIFQTNRPGEALTAGIARAAAAGAQVINFNEFVFVYETDQVSYAGTDYAATMKSYYHYGPFPLRLMRIFQAGLPVSTLEYGGHMFPPGSVRVHKESFVSRHYIALSRAHAEGKYLNRRFSAANVARGWHFNRVNMRREQFAAPPASRLKKTASLDQPLDASQPEKKHFWEWQ